ncbi:MAG: hypothetical protein HYV33_01105 [Candidatus Kerfeldbacteria bacterium]|nr:hypothetical protein [Candidatus Kerfeldbacteria bacterium]
MTWLAILGNTPELSALELGVTWSGGQVAVLNELPVLDRLGGTVKLGRVITRIPRDLFGLEQLYHWLAGLPADKKLWFGFSVYAGDNKIDAAVVKHYAKKLRATGIIWKKQLRAAGRSVRFVVSDEPELSSVIVHKEHLLDNQTDFMVVLYKHEILLAQTIAVQNYRQFSDHDYGRPQRDHHSGMLPPKVARMMLNIGMQNMSAQTLPATSLLDPFCGSGTVLQEALTLGYTNIIGSDISAKAIEDTTTNLEWLQKNVPTLQATSLPKLYQTDVLKLDQYIPPHSINCVISEGYLGPVHPHKIDKIHRQLTTFYQLVLHTLPKLLQTDARVVLALPAWVRYNAIQTMSLQQAIDQNGFQVFHQPIIYKRMQAKVARQIHFMVYLGK